MLRPIAGAKNISHSGLLGRFVFSGCHRMENGMPKLTYLLI